MPKTILIVDDHSAIRRLIRMTLEFEDCQIFEAADGESALRFLNDRRADVVLLDVMMPGAINGLETCRRIRQRPDMADVRVLILSARGQAADREAGLEAGADEYLVKPFSPLELLERLGSMDALPTTF